MSSKKSAIDQELIRDLAALLKEADLTEIEVEQDDFRIRVTRGTGSTTVAAAAHAPVQLQQSPEPDDQARIGLSDPAKHPGTLSSPMVGTAYLSPEPGAAPFVALGDTVNAGQTVMIVEAMKTMNPIPAHRGGKITSVLVEDSQPVEYGEPLMIIE